MSFLVDGQRRLLTLALNRLVPADGTFPGAGDAGVVEYVERVVGGAPAPRRLFLEGLAAIAEASLAHRGRDFDALAGDEQDGVLAQVEAAHPAFFDALLVHAYSGYYSHPEVIRLLAIEARPPQPRGHHLEPFDPALLASVRGRRPFYRPAP